MNDSYYVKNAHEAAKLVDASIFYTHLKSLEFRNDRLSKGTGSKRIPLHADILKDRCTGVSISFNELMQADYVLYLARYIHAEADDWWIPWFPITLVYASYHDTGFEVFIRGETAKGFKNIQVLLGISDKGPLTDLLENIQNGIADAPQFDGFRPIRVSHFMNYDKLGTRS